METLLGDPLNETRNLLYTFGAHVFGEDKFGEVPEELFSFGLGG